MSDTRWAKVESCFECKHLDDAGEFCRAAEQCVDMQHVIPAWCPLPRPGDIPEVAALMLAASVVVEEWQGLAIPVEKTGEFRTSIAFLDAALAAFDKTK